MKTLMGFIFLCFLQGVVNIHNYYDECMMQWIMQNKHFHYQNVRVCYKESRG